MKCGDFDVAEPYRKYARYWLPGDELKAGRALGRRLRKHDRIELLAQIRSIYANAASRADVEDVEFQVHDDSVHKLPPPGKGMQVHEPYMAYAHWVLIHRMLTGAGVERVQANMDIDSMSRAAFICAFADEIARGDAHGVLRSLHQVPDGGRAEAHPPRGKPGASPVPGDVACGRAR